MKNIGENQLRVLFVSMTPLNYNSSATIQNHGIVKGLSSLGHVVDILTLEENKDAFAYDESMNEIFEIINKRYVIKATNFYNKMATTKADVYDAKNSYNGSKKRIIPFIKRFAKNLYNYFQIFDAQKLNVKNLDNLKMNYKKYDVILSSSDPKSSHLIAQYIFNNNDLKAKWVQYWGDPFYNDITRKKKIIDPLVKIKEKKLYAKADKIIYASPLTLKIQRNTFPKYRKKMDYVNQVIHGTNKNQTKEYMGYYGAYNSNIRNIKPLYEAATIHKKILEIAGPSNVKLNDKNNIKIYNKLNYKEVIKKEKEASILIAIANKKGTQIPGKIYYLAGYSQPIIVILDGAESDELREYLDSFNRFILCENNIESISKAFFLAEEQLKERRMYIIDNRLLPETMAKNILKGI